MADTSHQRAAEAFQHVSGETSHDVLARLRLVIAGEAARLGEPLPTERDLAARFGVSRRAVRHALSVLETEGRIWRRQGKGTFIGPAASAPAASISRLSSRTNLLEAMEVRLEIEPALATLAASRARPDQITMLERLVERACVAGDPGELELWDSAFHRAIAEAAGNRLFLDLFELVDAVRREKTWQTHRENARTPERLRQYHTQHRDLVAAIAGRDGKQAGRVMRRHIEAVRAALTQAAAQEVTDAE